MSSAKAASPVRKTANRRPGGRTSEITGRVFEATMALIEKDGITAITFQRVAESAGVGRATLYRRWPEPMFLVADALAATAADRIRILDTGSLRGDLTTMLEQIGAFIDSPTGRAAIIAGLSGREQPEFAKLASQLWERRRDDVAPIFDRAKKRGELPAESDGDVLFSLAAGALYARIIVMAQPINEQWIEKIVDQLIS